MNKAWVFSAVVLVSACVDATEQGDDPIDDSFLDDGMGGKQDAFGITEDSPDAVGVLELANTADGPLLKTAGLGTHAITNLLAHRNGADHLPSTTDDDPFDDLHELDAVPYIGASAFSHLLDYARAHGYVTSSDPLDPFDPASCSGATITVAQLQQVTQNGTASLPDGVTYTRSRKCNGVLGCGAWSATTELGAPGKSTLSYQSTATKIFFAAEYYRSVAVELPQGAFNVVDKHRWTFDFSPASASPLGAVSGAYGYWDGSSASVYVPYSDPQLTFTGTCLRAYGRVPATANQQQTEIEVVFLATF